MLPLPENQASRNIFQPPSDDVNNNLGARMSDQDNSLLMRQCLELLANVSAAVDRNTKIMDLVANHIMHGRPGATGETVSSSAVQESDDGSDENVSEVKTRRFRAHAKRPKHKDASELRLRVSRISTNRPHCLNITAG
jgi:hypothetical protein